MPARKRETPPKGVGGLVEKGPAWIQAIVAALTLLVTVLIAIGIIGRNPPAPSSPPATGPVVAATGAPATAPRVVLKAVRESPEVRGVGEFENIDLTLDTIYLLGVPPAGSDLSPVLVEGTPTNLETISPGLSSGLWEAFRPAPATGLAWQALIYPASLGASGGLADLKANGPDAAGVKAFSEIIQPTP